MSLIGQTITFKKGEQSVSGEVMDKYLGKRLVSMGYPMFKSLVTEKKGGQSREIMEQEVLQWIPADFYLVNIEGELKSFLCEDALTI